ncbi:hypothetical protein CR513_05360, partial [Mucuna pruriens]
MALAKSKEERKKLREELMKRQERDKGNFDIIQWGEAWKESMMVVVQYKSRIQNERKLSENLMLEFQAALESKRKYVEDSENHIGQTRTKTKTMEVPVDNLEQ